MPTPRHALPPLIVLLAPFALLFVMLMSPPALAVQFGPLSDLQTGIGFTTVLTFGPEDPDPLSNADGCVYAVHGSNGEVHRICFDATKTVTSSTIVVDLNGTGGVNNVLGIAIDPDSDPTGEIHLYLGYSDTNTAPNNGKIARAVSTDGGATYTVDEDFITGLGRSSFDHQTNGLDFGPDKCLYIANGNMSNAGYDTAHAETRLSSGILRACFKLGSGVDPAFDRNCGDTNTQEACDVEVYASGMRNPYDIVWHSNGRLYNADNDSNPGFRDNCGAEANNFGCACEEPLITPIGDELNLIEQDAYYGSPNPYRANPAGLQCNGGTDGGDACSVDADCGGGGTCEDLSSLCTDAVCGDDAQCHYFGYGDAPQPGEDPNGIYREPIAQIGALLDGLTEYRSRFEGRFGPSFCSDWNGDLLVTGGPGSVRRFELTSDGTGASHMGTGNLSGISGLDVVVGPDGTIYAADLNNGKVTYIEPVPQSNPAQANFFAYCATGEACVDGACSADTDNDGLGDVVDPCPSDPRNLCAGPVAVDGNTGNPIRLNANTGTDACAGTKIDCNGDTWLGDFGYNQAASAFTCNLAGGCVIDATPVFGCTDAQTEDLYECEHWDDAAAPELIYSFDVPDGDYVVNVHLMNSFEGTTAVGDRAFNILVEGLVEYGGLDPVAAAGGSGIPVVRSALVTVADGNGLQIEFGHVTENPGVKAIEVLEVYVPPECAVDLDCDDGNVCTTDACNAQLCEHTPNTLSCDDGASCTTGDVCGGGVCSGLDACTGGTICDMQADTCVSPSVLRRINANGSAHTGIDFPGSWEADTGECGGNTYSTSNSINGTADDALFQGERWGNPVICAIDDSGSPLPAGNYTVNLYLAEIYHGPGCANAGGGVGSRVFDVMLEGATVESGIDIFAEAGCGASTTDPSTGVIVRSYQVAVTDGTLDVSLPSTADNAKISAIEVISAGAPFECSIDADCDDADICTANVCNGGSCTYPFDSGACVAAYPYGEGFDEGTGGWSDVGGDDFDWTANMGSTPTSGTGPTGDHTTGSDTYLYTEATGFTPAQTAILEGPCLDLAGMASASASFYYHMLGGSMGSLDVEAAADCGTTWTPLLNVSGNQGSSWQLANVDLSSHAGARVRLRFVGTTGATDTSDLAIDDVYVTASVNPPTTVPTEIQQPGTQPHEVGDLEDPTNCGLCHQGYAGGDDLDEPSAGWGGSMMSHASRDPVFWAALAVAEQDFLGSGDMCLRCHVPKGWYGGRSEPTDGSALLESDAGGVSCDMCHRLTNPDGSELVGVQNSPFLANDEGTPAEGYHGGAMAVLWDQTGKLGPYDDATPPHGAVASQYHRSADMCGTCHDVSNPLVGDLAPNNGALVPLSPGSFSGVPGAPVDTKAAFNNKPHAYGTIERTSSEHASSAFATLLISDFATLPPDLQAGALLAARDAALLAGQGGDYADGTPRTFSCQSCHMRPRVGEGASGNPGVRNDLPAHDLTGGNYWAPEAIQYLDGLGQLRLGSDLSTSQITQMDAGAARALANLEDAATLSVTGNSLRVTNLTGHKLITGYPEGRRMWLNIKWYDSGNALIAEEGEYGSIIADIDGTPTAVDTILDPDNTILYQMHNAITQEWAVELITSGLSPTLPLSFDRETGAVTYTLGDLAAQAPGTYYESQHFVLNNFVASDTRIPPYGLRYDDALARNALPIPETQYGNPGPGGVYDYWDDVSLVPPVGAHHATIELLYQPTSWEYIQFLHEANTGANAFLSAEGDNLLDAWLNTGMAAPHTMATTTWSAPACSDTLDNDGDGLVDALDPGCESPDDTTETCGPTSDATCDGVDDDCDGLVDEDFDDANCSDGLFCNGDEFCSSGSCAAGPPPVLDDGVGCTIDVCNEGLDLIEHVADDAACDNANVCDGLESCDLVADCQAGVPLDCGDGNACTLESCDPVGGCQSDGPVICDNGDVCDGTETCDTLAGCIGGATLDCDDNDACTADSCDAISGCAHEPIPGCPSAVPATPPYGPLALALLLMSAAGLVMNARGRRVTRG